MRFVLMLIAAVLASFFGHLQGQKVIYSPSKETTPLKGILEIHFDPDWEGKPFQFNAFYENGFRENLQLVLFKFYASNFKLVDMQGRAIVLPSSYHLVDMEYQPKIRLAQVPAGNFKTLSFMLGIDSSKTKNGGYTGDMDPVHGMFWNTWGVFINWMMNGYYKDGKGKLQLFEYHVGGFERPHSTLQTLALTAKEGDWVVSGGDTTKIVVGVNIRSFFDGPPPISVFKCPVVSDMGDSAKRVSENFPAMFRIKQITWSKK